MAVEQFANNAQSTLAAAIAAGDTTLTVAAAGAFPAAGNFRLLIDSEILLVTAVSGSTFTVSRGQEGTTAAAHAYGTYVTHLITAAGLLNCPRSMTTAGDVEYLASSGAVTRLGIGSAGQVLTVASGLPSWAAPSGGVGTPISRTSAYTANTGDLVECDASGGAFTVTLPAASGNSGKTVAVQKVDTGGNAVTVSRAGSDVIKGLASGSVTSFNVRGEGDLYWLVSDGTSWHVAARYIAPSYCWVQNSTEQTIATTTTTALTFDTNNSDADGLHSVSVNTSRITIKRPGKYLIIGSAGFHQSAAASYRQFSIRKNGSSQLAQISVNSPDYYFCTPSIIADLAAGDYIELTAYQVSGGNLNTYVDAAPTNPNLAVWRLGD